MEQKLKVIEERLSSIENRNRAVEQDKAWETSWFRKILLIAFTYLAIGLYLKTIQVSNPWLNAIVPALGFFLSSLTLPLIKKYWIRQNYK